jgi:hypothetical protein
MSRLHRPCETTRRRSARVPARFLLAHRATLGIAIAFLSVFVPIDARLRGEVFVRGLVNDDLKLDISDPVALLGHLFGGAPAPRCEKAADANDDGNVDISDAIYLLQWLFTGGSPIPPPYPEPGLDPTPDELGCSGAALEDFRIEPSALAFETAGETMALRVTALRNGELVDLTRAATGTVYTVDRPEVAFVYRDGLVEAMAAGTAIVIASQGETTASASVTVTGSAAQGEYRIVAANDLGMHCVDRDFSVFSILPPFNVVRAQVIRSRANGLPELVDDGSIILRYSPAEDRRDSVNSTSIGKSNFWEHARALFGIDLREGEGLLGAWLPADAPESGPQPLTYDVASGLFVAAGIPIIDKDDAGVINPYPLLRLSAVDRSSGDVLATAEVVVPVSSETDCQNCHATGGTAANRTDIAWSDDSDVELQTRRNVLLLHDAREGTNLVSLTPVLCASCHYSAALDLSGAGPQGAQLQRTVFSIAMHGFHGRQVKDDQTPVFPSDGDVYETCYQCHPGRITECHRGAMKDAGMACHECHGDMLSVGGDAPLLAGGSIDGSNDGGTRRPWVDLPRCQSCHTGDATRHATGADLLFAADGIRLVQAWRNNDASASPILAASSRFAENPNKLYRFSHGHGDVACEHCHGSTHAIWPNSDPESNDNLMAERLQGHAGTIIECGACHAAGALALTVGGPHGMHNVNDPRWTDDGHERFFEHDADNCKACHGADLLGTPLSRTAVDRQYRVEDKIVRVAKGTEIRCNLCHGIPDEEDD